MKQKMFQIRWMIWSAALVVISLFASSVLAEPGVRQPQPCKIFVIGFVGGMRSPEDLTQGVVQIGNRLKSFNDPAMQVKIYSHWHWREAYQFIHQNFALSQSEQLSAEATARGPKIMIYGHSLGGWAVLKLSRRLEKAGIPVELAVQIDSVGIGDEIVPRNVKVAANFYQRTVWPIRGEKRIRAADGNRTTITGNFLIQKIGHEALARSAEISDYIVERVRAFCSTISPREPQTALLSLARLSKGLHNCRAREAFREMRTID